MNGVWVYGVYGGVYMHVRVYECICGRKKREEKEIEIRRGASCNDVIVFTFFTRTPSPVVCFVFSLCPII